MMSLVAARAGAEPLSLDEALRIAADRGPDQAAARAQVELVRADAWTARLFPNPTLSLLGARAEPVFSASLAFRLPLLGQRGAHVRAAERAVEQAGAEADAAVWRLRHDTRIAYFAAVRAEEEERIAGEVVELTRRVADMARTRFEEGAGNRLEKEQAQLVHVRAQQDVSDRKAVTRTARLELARLLGEPADRIGALTDGLAAVGATPPLDELLADARARHPELRALAHEREAALARAHAARVDRVPVPTVELGIDLLNESTCNPGSLSSNTPSCVGPRGALSFDVPIFNLNGGPIARGEAEARAADAKANAARVRLETQVASAYENLTAATVRARFFDAQYVPAAASVEEMAREGFAAGRTGLLPLLEAERAILDARLGRAEALYAVQAARADLEEAGGIPLSTP
jgi:cobalt-zinc-cadmium efflux system outer membrane protein